MSNSNWIQDKVIADLEIICNSNKQDVHFLEKEINLYLEECKELEIVKDYSNLRIIEANTEKIDISLELIDFETTSQFSISISDTK